MGGLQGVACAVATRQVHYEPTVPLSENNLQNFSQVTARPSQTLKAENESSGYGFKCSFRFGILETADENPDFI